MTILAFVLVALGSFVAGAVWRGINARGTRIEIREVQPDTCTEAFHPFGRLMSHELEDRIRREIAGG